MSIPKGLFLLVLTPFILGSDFMPEVPLNGVFEAQVTHPKKYKNPFNFKEIELRTQFTSPSGRVIHFRGFYDGVSVWKFRFMPDEIGTWKYRYRFNDRSKDGSGKFHVVKQGALKGVIRAYRKNPRWFAYEGKEPVFLKSYLIPINAFTGTPLSWAVAHVYQKFLDKGYNHLQLFVLPASSASACNFIDAPASVSGLLFSDLEPSKTMNLAIWHSMEEHLRWLNDHGIAVHFFKGFDGKDKGPRWKRLSKDEKEFYVRYVTARLAPFANICGWNFSWETKGDRLEPELMALLKKYDPWDHLRTYHDEYPQSNHYSNPLYTFAAIENKGFLTSKKESLSHHYASLYAYRRKPVFISEGNGLWMWGWCANEDETRRSAWGTVTAGASFSWNDLPGKSGECLFSSQDIFHTHADEYLDILYKILTNDVTFYKMKPRDELLSGFSGNAYLLAEEGEQYLVYLEAGGRVTLGLSKVKASSKFSVLWIDAKNGKQTKLSKLIEGGALRDFTSPFPGESVLVLRKSR